MPRTLAAAVRRDVTSTARTRGEHYFHSGRVTIDSVEEQQLTASVRGTRTYQVLLRLEAERLLVDCTCPYLVDNLEACKHVWATILAVDAQRLLTPTHDLYLDIVSPHDDGFPWDEGADHESDDHLADDRVIGKRRGGTSPHPAPSVSDRMKRYWQKRREGPASHPQRKPKPPPAWQIFLTQVRLVPPEPSRALAVLAGEIVYVFDPVRSASGGVHIEIVTRQRKKSGEWANPKPLSTTRREIASLPNADDQWLLESMCGALPSYGPYDYVGMTPVPAALVLSAALQRSLVSRLCATGRFLLRVPARPGMTMDDVRLVPIDWDEEPVTFDLRITGDAKAGYTISGTLTRAGEIRPLSELLFVTGTLALVMPQAPDIRSRFAALDLQGGERWLSTFIRSGPVTIPGAHALSLIEALAQSGCVPAECPPELVLEEFTEPPRRILRIRRSKRQAYRPGSGRLDVQLSFAYGERETEAQAPDAVLFDPERRRAWRRDRTAEAAALARILTLGVRQVIGWGAGEPRPVLDMAARQLPTVVRVLTVEGWQVEAEGRLHRTPGAVTLDVRSGVDWFELHGGIDFGGVSATLPALLAAWRRGDTFVTLDDGSVGTLPETWLERNGWIAELGAPEGNHVRFTRSQTALLSAWASSQPEVSCDEIFSQARNALATFAGIAPIDPPATFTGVLRGYQRDALAWFGFLRQFGFGGCLADEMGLGKTVMVLAALDARRLAADTESGTDRRPSLIVVPRSLVFNWQDEARRFSPALRLLDCSASDRHEQFARVDEADVVLTTYGTLRRDIERLKEIPFDYVILDEAQAVKNARTNAAAAVRLLRARHRLALSGTPVENHLGELWSLFEFLNPGMLGAASRLGAGTAQRAMNEERLAVLAQGLRPFILRRTKEQVAPELPSRTEQTLYCDLEPAQRTLYNELRAHYRATLLQRVARQGIERSKIYVLEALLRLRQAACHPGLVDRTRTGDASAKLDTLVPRLLELAEDGRKVLVFSQFTSLLALLRPRLEEVGLSHAYLDGRTRDRAARVRQFEEDGCPLFLISLKAGGVGLNLAAAEYVFLLDPWWNPAVEAQAIDRAHRIGQTKPVFAYRLIARDTVEEKVLELQVTKRRLAEAIVRADDSLIRTLRREDLELLLS